MMPGSARYRASGEESFLPAGRANTAAATPTSVAGVSAWFDLKLER
jgi:hypothetical protein